MKNDKMSKRKKAITDYFMQSKKLNKGEDSMKTCQIMLFGVGIAAYPFFFLISVVICVTERSVKLSKHVKYQHYYYSRNEPGGGTRGQSPWKLLDFRVFET
jgi:hypothetical protein